MKLIKVLLVSFFIVFWGATSVLADNEQLASEVMEIHDIAMAKMTTMHELKLQLQELEEKEGVQKETTESIASLKTAHRGMMQWMREYKKDQSQLSEESRKAYLLEEKVKIQHVSDIINNSIASSEKILSDFK